MEINILNRQNTVLNKFIAEIRDRRIQCDSMRFRRNLERIGELMAYEISKRFRYTPRTVETPLGEAEVELYDNEIVIATILRAGLPFHQGFLNYFDDAQNAFVSAYRKSKKDGTYTIHAKAVVDAAGGFGANNDLVSKYVPRLKGFATTNHPGAQGEGIVLSEKIGAQLVDMTEIQTHPTVVPKVGEMITEAVRGNGAVLINKDGSRFYNELNTRDAVSAAILKQKDGVAYLFFDSDMQKSLKATNNYIKQSYCLKGETLDELAGKMGVPADKLKASLEAWKQGKAAGKDAFGRADMPRNLDQAPFYAIMVTPAVHHTMGGIKIDSKTQVYNTKGQIIPGYFAAGEITGGVHGGNRLGGNAQADIVTFGRIAGQQSYIYAMQAAAADKAKK